MEDKKIDWKSRYNNLKYEFEAYKKTFGFERCWLCGTTKNITKHHFEIRRKRKLGLKKVPLCRDCHNDVEELRKDKKVKRLISQYYDKGFNDSIDKITQVLFAEFKDSKTIIKRIKKEKINT